MSLQRLVDVADLDQHPRQRQPRMRISRGRPDRLFRGLLCLVEPSESAQQSREVVQCPRRLRLGAHSLFGTMATRYASRRSEQLGRLVIYGAPGVGPYRMPWQLRYAAIRSAIRPTPRNADRFDRFALLDVDATRRRDSEWYQAFDAYTRAQAGHRHVKRTMSRLVADQTKPIAATDLARIDIPVSLMWGRHDRMVPLSIGQAAAKNHRWPLHAIDDAAHAPHIENPAGFVAALTMALDDQPTQDNGVA
ncbi:MAG: alpha/beta hydrolase [Ilumatobacteraceae bacterium]